MRVRCLVLRSMCKLHVKFKCDGSEALMRGTFCTDAWDILYRCVGRSVQMRASWGDISCEGQTQVAKSSILCALTGCCLQWGCCSCGKWAPAKRVGFYSSHGIGPEPIAASQPGTSRWVLFGSIKCCLSSAAVYQVLPVKCCLSSAVYQVLSIKCCCLSSAAVYQVLACC
jgi:hypothetical protein